MLESFSKKEMIRFEEFAHSLYHNKEEKVVRLAQYLYNSYPDFTEINVTERRFFSDFIPREHTVNLD